MLIGSYLTLLVIYQSSALASFVPIRPIANEQETAGGNTKVVSQVQEEMERRRDFGEQG